MAGSISKDLTVINDINNYLEETLGKIVKNCEQLKKD